MPPVVVGENCFARVDPRDGVERRGREASTSLASQTAQVVEEDEVVREALGGDDHVTVFEPRANETEPRRHETPDETSSCRRQRQILDSERSSSRS